MSSEGKSRDNSKVISETTDLVLEHISDYLSSKGYKVIDLTKIIHKHTLKGYINNAKNHHHIIYYFVRNEITEGVFKKYNAEHTLNFFWVFVNKYFICDNLKIDQLKRFFEKNVITASNIALAHIECMICLEKFKVVFTCNNCCYAMCLSCLYKLRKFGTIGIHLCPQCRIIM